MRRAPVNAVTRAAEEPRPVLWASARRTLKSVNFLAGIERGGAVNEEDSWDGCE